MNALKPDHYSFPAQSAASGSASPQPNQRLRQKSQQRRQRLQQIQQQQQQEQLEQAKQQEQAKQLGQPGQRRRAHAQARQNSQRTLAIEACAKLGINIFLSVIAITALVKLIPFNLGQEESLKELRGKVSEVQNRVDTLQADFNYHFDPQQTLNAMQEQSVRTIPGQRQIVLVEPNSSVAESFPPADR